MALLTELAGVKRSYDKVADALKEVEETGYGIVVPPIDSLVLEEPEIMKQGGRYGVRLKASAPSIHIKRSKQKFRSGKQAKRRTGSCEDIRASAIKEPVREMDSHTGFCRYD